MSNTTLAARWPLPLDDPYPALRQLRDTAPVHWFEPPGAHFVVSHGVAREVLHGSGWSPDPSLSPRLASRLPTGMTGSDLRTRSMLFCDPPPHTRLRGALSPWLTPRPIEGFRHRISAIAHAALADQADGGELDVMEAVAHAVPLAVICELLGAPAELATRLREETPRVAAVLDPLAGADDIQAGSLAAFSLLLEILPLVAERQARPGPDLISALMAGPSDDGGLAADEAVMMALLLLAAGHETTANLIGNAVITLHDHRLAARSLRRHPDQIPAAVEELLRHESPVQLTSRVARRDTDLGGIAVPKGGLVLLSLSAANRDPAVFPDPDHLDINRHTSQHLAFGHGTHFCAGAALARVEAQEILRHLLQLTPPIEDRDITLERGRSATFRRVNTLLLMAR